ncbi:unnamed protein product [Malus baccata var. baccata]
MLLVLMAFKLPFLLMLRFLLRSGREYEQPSTDSDKPSPKILGYFGFHTNFRKQSLDKSLLFLSSSTSLKEQNAHVASVKNIVESHADFLMSGKELSKLVAFVKGTQFDLVREKWKCSAGEFCFRAGIKPHCHILQKLLRFALLTEHGSLFPAPSGYTTEPSHPALTEYHDLLGDFTRDCHVIHQNF